MALMLYFVEALFVEHPNIADLHRRLVLPCREVWLVCGWVNSERRFLDTVDRKLDKFGSNVFCQVQQDRASHNAALDKCAMINQLKCDCSDVGLWYDVVSFCFNHQLIKFKFNQQHSFL